MWHVIFPTSQQTKAWYLALIRYNISSICILNSTNTQSEYCIKKIHSYHKCFKMYKKDDFYCQETKYLSYCNTTLITLCKSVSLLILFIGRMTLFLEIPKVLKKAVQVGNDACLCPSTHWWNMSLVDFYTHLWFFYWVSLAIIC
jgi:hypothetical protein